MTSCTSQRHPIGSDFRCGIMQVVELALGCVHKLVSHAWLHGESSVFEGLMDDGSDVVSQVQ